MKPIALPSSPAPGRSRSITPTLGVGGVFADPDLRRILLELHSNGLGDVVNLVPLIQEIAAIRPDVEIVVISSQWKLPLRWAAPHVTTVAEVTRAEQRAPGTHHVDLSAEVRYHLYAPHWLQFFFITGMGTYQHRGDPFPLMPATNPRADLMEQVIGAGSGRGAVLLHLENTRREWEGRNTDPQNLLLIARSLATQGFRILEIGNDNPPSGEFPHLGTLSLEELVWAMKHAVGFVGIDSFPMHLAALYDKPLLGFFAATQPEVVLPPLSRLTVIRNEAIPCNGCVYITRPRNYNVCVLGHLECAHRLPEAYLLERARRFVESMAPGAAVQPTRHAMEHQWRMAQLLFEDAALLERLRGKRFISGDVRREIAASISSEMA